MDQERFDQLTVQLAHGTTRRTLLQGLGGTGLAAFLGIIGLGHGPEVVAAKGHGRQNRRQAHRHKRSARQEHLRSRDDDCGKKGGACCPPDDACHGNLSCVAGVCVKPNRGGGNCAMARPGAAGPALTRPPIPPTVEPAGTLARRAGAVVAVIAWQAVRRRWSAMPPASAYARRGRVGGATARRTARANSAVLMAVAAAAAADAPSRRRATTGPASASASARARSAATTAAATVWRLCGANLSTGHLHARRLLCRDTDRRLL